MAKIWRRQRRTESTIVAARNQESSKICIKNKSMKEEIDSKRRLCKQHKETPDHITSGCPILAKKST
jgi:hypothetical protein